MNVVVVVPLGIRHHSDNHRLRPSITKDGEHFTISFGKRGRIKTRSNCTDLRNLAEALHQLADAYEVANGNRKAVH